MKTQYKIGEKVRIDQPEECKKFAYNYTLEVWAEIVQIGEEGNYTLEFNGFYRKMYSKDIIEKLRTETSLLKELAELRKKN